MIFLNLFNSILSELQETQDINTSCQYIKSYIVFFINHSFLSFCSTGGKLRTSCLLGRCRKTDVDLLPSGLFFMIMRSWVEQWGYHHIQQQIILLSSRALIPSFLKQLGCAWWVPATHLHFAEDVNISGATFSKAFAQLLLMSVPIFIYNLDIF